MGSWFQNLWELLVRLWSNDQTGAKLTSLQKLLVLGLLGVLLIWLGSSFQVEKQEKPLGEQLVYQPEGLEAFSQRKESTNPIRQYEEMYEVQLREILEQIAGVEDVSVMVNLESSEEIIIQQNIRTTNQNTHEKDSQQGTRVVIDSSSDTQAVIIQQEDQQQPVIIKTIKPKVRGVLVVAKGVEHAKVQRWIMESVQKVLDVPLHKISVVPKK